uniref:Uncharacterized protein n=1 Tax=Physcomitrium patens TaxID=3218 RepID=A0A2K1IGF7_PHYPA|nr:hypothetical protein PHYPA_028952 [Physcomitrium patens]
MSPSAPSSLPSSNWTTRFLDLAATDGEASTPAQRHRVVGGLGSAARLLDAELVHGTPPLNGSSLHQTFQRHAQHSLVRRVEPVGVIRLEVPADLGEAGPVALLQVKNGVPDQRISWGCHGELMLTFSRSPRGERKWTP